ncbi:MAG: YHS domain-containing protein, partial [Patescibacteria group bacterium]
MATVNEAKDVYTDFEGKRVYFCCPGCIEKFNAEPQKFIEQFQKAGIVLESAPVEGVTTTGMDEGTATPPV